MPSMPSSRHTRSMSRRKILRDQLYRAARDLGNLDANRNVPGRLRQTSTARAGLSGNQPVDDDVSRVALVAKCRITPSMTATLVWLDYSERDRRRALDVVDLLREPSTVDELGLEAVRDVFADLLFPGTSTIQTRARYLLFVPWQCLELERLRVPSRQVVARGRRAEIGLIDALADLRGAAGGDRDPGPEDPEAPPEQRLLERVFSPGVSAVFGVRAAIPPVTRWVLRLSQGVG